MESVIVNFMDIFPIDMALNCLKTKFLKREEKNVKRYFDDIFSNTKYTPLTREREVELTKCFKKGDQGAHNKLICANLRFVVSVAKKFQGQGLSFTDLINEGNYGLIEAAHRFDETRGFKFISFAVWWIRKAILEALAKQSRLVRLPLNRIGTISKIHKTIAQFSRNSEPYAESREIGRGT